MSPVHGMAVHMMKSHSWFNTPPFPARTQRPCPELRSALLTFRRIMCPDLVRQVVFFMSIKPSPDLLPAGRYETVGEIRAAGFNGVKRGKCIVTGNYVALKSAAKEPRCSKMQSLREVKESREHMTTERRILQQHAGKHDNIINYYGCFENTVGATLVLELCEGDLNDAINKPPRGSYITVEEARQHSLHILLGVQYLHSHRVAHRDIKPENVLIVRDNNGATTAKIADFGLSLSIPEGLADECTDFSVLGTNSYMAPEVYDTYLHSRPREGLKECLGVDIYSTGVTMYAMLARKCPFSMPMRGSGMAGWKSYRKRQQGGADFTRAPRWEAVPREAIDIVRSMLAPDPGVRPTASQVLQQPWLRGVPEP
eukprot:Hpha_TRINITY_DN16622_c1_g3::TRINITY_DN16622_c1_g3_i1::g.181942::m.181942